MIGNCLRCQVPQVFEQGNDQNFERYKGRVGGSAEGPELDNRKLFEMPSPSETI